MTPATVAVYEAVLLGAPAAMVQSSIDAVSPEERELLCTLCCAQQEAALQSSDRASSIAAVLALNGRGLLPTCRLYQVSAGWCPLVCDSPLVLPDGQPSR